MILHLILFRHLDREAWVQWVCNETRSGTFHFRHCTVSRRELVAKMFFLSLSFELSQRTLATRATVTGKINQRGLI